MGYDTIRYKKRQIDKHITYRIGYQYKDIKNRGRVRDTINQSDKREAHFTYGDTVCWRRENREERREEKLERKDRYFIGTLLVCWRRREY